MLKIRTYKELSKLHTFDERFNYLKLTGIVGESTFGYDRWLNQRFYTSNEWKSVRDFIIVRDNGCDLGIAGYEIHRGLIVHHMNPVSLNDIINNPELILDPEFLITTSHRTHNAIHYGNADNRPRIVIERKPGDTTLW